MPAGALFIGWGTPHAGRETQALQLFQEVLGIYARWQQQGDITSFEPVALDPHGGDLSGFMLIRGEPDKLALLRNRDDFHELNVRAGLLLTHFGVTFAFTGDDLQKLFATFGRYAAQGS